MHDATEEAMVTSHAACSSTGSRFSRCEAAAAEMRNRDRGSQSSWQLKAGSIGWRRSVVQVSKESRVRLGSTLYAARKRQQTFMSDPEARSEKRCQA